MQYTGLLAPIALVFAILVALAVLWITYTVIRHTVRLSREAVLYPAPGVLTEVRDKQLHVYAEGTGTSTLVFLAGHGTCNPVLDFKPLWKLLSDEFRIAVVERSGYGWSSPSKSARDIDTVLEETREALVLAGEKGPYVLVPHSMSGLEALYWAKRYPREIQAILALDPVTPETAAILPAPSRIRMFLMFLVARAGIARWMSDADVEKLFPLLRSDRLSAEDKKTCMALFYRSAVTGDMLRELSCLRENARKVAGMGPPADTPMFFFISRGPEHVTEGWREALTGFLATIHRGEHMLLDSGHYPHYTEAERIAGRIRVGIAPKAVYHGPMY